MEVILVMGNDIENYGTFKKDRIDKLKVDIENVLNDRVNDEDEKLDLLKKISNLKIKLEEISEEDATFNKSEFQKKLRIGALIEKEGELWERVQRFGRD